MKASVLKLQHSYLQQSHGDSSLGSFLAIGNKTHDSLRAVSAYFVSWPVKSRGQISDPLDPIRPKSHTTPSPVLRPVLLSC